MAGQPGAAQPRSSFISQILSDINVQVGINEPKPVVTPVNKPQPVGQPLQNWLSKIVSNGTSSGIGIYVLVGFVLVALVLGASLYHKKR